jgi:hypothetical protein
VGIDCDHSSKANPRLYPYGSHPSRKHRHDSLVGDLLNPTVRSKAEAR